MKNFVLGLLAVAGGAAGFWIGTQVVPGHPVVGGAAGAFAVLAIAKFLLSMRRRWLALICLCFVLLASYAIGSWPGLFWSAAAVVITVVISAGVLRDLYGGSVLAAVRHHVTLILDIMKGFQVIDQGRTVAPANAASPLFGPMMVIVRPGNAAIFTSSSLGTVIAGPGVRPTGQFEFVRRIYNLERRQRVITLRHVLSEDMLASTITVRLLYGIDIPPEVQRREVPWETIHSDLIKKLDTEVRDWEGETVCVVDGILRRGISALPFQELLKGPTQKTIEERTLRQANVQLDRCGAKIFEILIEHVEPAAELTDVSSRQYVANGQVQVEVAKAVAAKEALVVMADAYRVAKLKDMTELEIYREMLRRTLELMSKDPATKILLTPELRDLLAPVAGP